jgi:Predicted transcriptional regulators
MSLTSSPIVRRQRLGAELRRMRKAHELTLDQVAERLGWASNSKVSRIEKGQSRPDLADVMDLLDLYEVTGGKREELIAIARDAANTRGWWRSIAGLGQRQRGYAELEVGAAEIREYTQFHVPGLLQTQGYARARVMSGRDLYGNLDIDADFRARETRQLVLRRDVPPQYEAIIEESALQRNVAPPEVMRDQLEHLVGLTELPNVTIQVLPSNAKVGDFHVPHTAFSLYRFQDPADPETVALETLTSDIHIHDEEDLAQYKMVYGWLRAAALPPAKSVDYLGRLATQK